MQKTLKILLIIMLFLISNDAINARSNMSPFAYKLSKTIKINSKATEKILSDSAKVSILFKFNQKFDFQKAKKLGANFHTIVSGIATAKISLDKYLEFIDLPGIEYIETGNTFSPLLDSAKSVTYIQAVINGDDLQKTYSGDGVVVGVIDAGFDYTHPAFRNSSNNQLIISRVWEQGKDGSSPKGFSYGRELSNSEEILQAKVDVENFSHGTHVAAIAVGQNIETAQQSVGIAPKSELVIVALKPPAQEQWKNTSASDIIDGVNYIFKYAESIGKPAVVNLSWGGQIGPHDGTSLFSQAIDGLVGKGKLFVTSAGNDGAKKLHISKVLGENEPLISYIQNSYNKQNAKNGLWIDAWGEEGKPFEFNFEILDKSTLKTKYQTEFHSTNKDTVINFIFTENNDKCEVNVHLSNSPFNNKPHAFVDVNCNKRFLFRISAKATEGKVNIWNWYLVDYYGITENFSSAGQSNAVIGNSECTISDFASTKKAIAVGAMVSKNKYINSQGNIINSNGKYGDIAFFSSRGPSADGRIKPDIVAPGMVVSSAVSSFDKAYEGQQESITARVESYGRQYAYACLMGTSMSAPVTSGAIALMLENNSNLSPEEAINLLKLNATVDNYTKEVPNDLWGWGKLNLHKVFTSVGIDEECSKTDEISLYPNPAMTTEVFLNIELEKSCYLQIILSDILGKEILKLYEGFSNSDRFSKTFDVSKLATGTYFLKTIINGKCKVEKLVIAQ